MHEELQLLLTLKPSDRLWQMPFAAALATGLPLLIGAYFDRMDYGLVSSLALAQALQLEKAYWVPVSCLAVIQGVSLRAVWTRQLHWVLGTGMGLLLAWGLLLLPLDKWTISLAFMALTLVIETAVVRHYAVATIFITPLTILLVEAATLGQASPAPLIQARFFDTVLGCLVGLAGGICLHSPRFRALVGGQMRRLLPSRLVRQTPPRGLGPDAGGDRLAVLAVVQSRLSPTRFCAQLALNVHSGLCSLLSNPPRKFPCLSLQ